MNVPKLFYFITTWIAFSLTMSPSFAQEPFGPDDFDAVYSDKGWIHYQLTRAEIETASSDPECKATQNLGSQNCVTGVHRFCEERGHVSGFAIESASSSNLADIYCLGPDAAMLMRGVTDDEVIAASGDKGAPLPPCDFFEPATNCAVGIDRYCRWAVDGSGGGFGPVENNYDPADPKAALVCFKDAYYKSLPGEERSDIESGTGCNLQLGPDPISDACSRALDSHCRAQDPELRGGFAPGELSGTKLRMGCVAESFWQANTSLPDSPALPVDIMARRAESDGTGGSFLETKLRHQTLSHNRSLSFDGRILLEEFVDAGERYLSFQTQVPEIFERPVSQEPERHRDRSFTLFDPVVPLDPVNPNPEDLPGYTYPVSMDVLFPDANPNLELSGKSAAICDPHNPTQADLGLPSSEQSVPSRISNPFACNAEGVAGTSSAHDHDCYDITVLAVAKRPPGGQVSDPEQLWGRRVTIVVKNPKRSVSNQFIDKDGRAYVVHVDVHEAAAQLALNTPAAILEPTVTGDGKLLFIQGNGRIQYSVLDDQENPCSVAEWDEFKNLEEMHFDMKMQRYGVAKFPLRDYLGNVVTSQSTNSNGIIGGYPWVSRDGDVLAYMAGRATLFYADPDQGGAIQARHEVIGHPTGDTSIPLPTDATELKLQTDNLPRVGLTVVGSWTQGKMVQPDSRNNAADFAMSGPVASHRLLRLYQDDPEGVEVGSTIRTKIASPENQFFHYPNLRPDTPREVVWHLAGQSQMDEFSFDDWLDPRALIVSTMITPIQAHDDDGRIAGMFLDGFDIRRGYDPADLGEIDVSSDPNALNGLGYRIGTGFVSPAWIANDATAVSSGTAAQANSDLDAAVQWNPPSHGRLLGGARSEPIAAGGYKGRGLWLDGENDRLDYIVPTQPAATQADFTSTDWFIHIAVDPRDLSSSRRLMTLPDGTWINLNGSTSISYGRGEATAGTMNLPTELAFGTGKWSTLAVASTPMLSEAQALRFYIDGYHFQTRIHSGGVTYFRMAPGRIQLGSVEGGFRGWLDDFKVLARRPNLEVICNHARGTLIGVSSTDDPLYDRADAYFDSSHNAVGAALPFDRRYPKYACERPVDAFAGMDIYETADHANYQCLGQTRRLDQVADPDLCLKDAFLFPEGPIFHNASRPDSFNNGFCLSCHVGSNPSSTMTPDPALTLKPMTSTMDDPRRQPMQWSPKIFGVVPDGLFGCGTGEPLPPGETEPCRTTENGRSLDFFLMPSHP